MILEDDGCLRFVTLRRDLASQSFSFWHMSFNCVRRIEFDLQLDTNRN